MLSRQLLMEVEFTVAQMVKILEAVATLSACTVGLTL